MRLTVNKMSNQEKLITLYKNKERFYNVFDIDAYIINLIFGYKVLDNRRCEFPKIVFEKVIDTLNNYKISYQINYFVSEPIYV